MRFSMLSLLLLLLLMMAASTSSAQTTQELLPAGKCRRNGKKIFTSYGCYQCHNYAAHGGLAGPRLAPKPIAFQAFIRQLRKPANEMPPYTAKVAMSRQLASLLISTRFY